MKCPQCHQKKAVVSYGFTKKKKQRFKCNQCDKTFTADTKFKSKFARRECPRCRGKNTIERGRSNKIERFYCKDCKRTFQEKYIETLYKNPQRDLETIVKLLDSQPYTANKAGILLFLYKHSVESLLKDIEQCLKEKDLTELKKIRKQVEFVIEKTNQWQGNYNDVLKAVMDKPLSTKDLKSHVQESRQWFSLNKDRMNYLLRKVKELAD